jgi:hypothetical protein
MDSAIRRLAIAGKENRSGEFRIIVREAKVIVRNAGGRGDCPDHYDD